MTQQYLRKASLLIGSDDNALDLSDLRFVFYIKRGDIQTPNSARIRIFNLSDNTAQRIQKEFTRVVLQAGYENGPYGLIFDGTIKQVRRGRTSPTETHVDVTAASGDAWYTKAIVNTTLAAGSTAADRVKVITDTMAQYGLKVGYLPWGGTQQAKPTAAEIAAQQAVVDAAKKAVDDTLKKASDLLAEGIQLRKQGDAEQAAGNTEAARALYLQALDLNNQSKSVSQQVDAVDLPRYNSELAKLKAMKEAAAQPDVPGADMPKLPRGRVMFGMARDHMECIANNLACDWSIQDTTFQLVPQNSYMPGEALVLTADTGLIGIPTQTNNGIEIKALLNPNARISGLVKIDNRSVQQYEYGLSVNGPAINNNLFAKEYARLNNDGVYKIMLAEHEGDTQGQPWYTTLICIDVDLSMTPAFVTRDSVAGAGPVKPWG